MKLAAAFVATAVSLMLLSSAGQALEYECYVYLEYDR
jgi:hypothetical protein